MTEKLIERFVKENLCGKESSKADTERRNAYIGKHLDRFIDKFERLIKVPVLTPVVDALYNPAKYTYEFDTKELTQTCKTISKAIENKKRERAVILWRLRLYEPDGGAKSGRVKKQQTWLATVALRVGENEMRMFHVWNIKAGSQYYTDLPMLFTGRLEEIALTNHEIWESNDTSTTNEHDQYDLAWLSFICYLAVQVQVSGEEDFDKITESVETQKSLILPNWLCLFTR